MSSIVKVFGFNAFILQLLIWLFKQTASKSGIDFSFLYIKMFSSFKDFLNLEIQFYLQQY